MYILKKLKVHRKELSMEDAVTTIAQRGDITTKEAKIIVDEAVNEALEAVSEGDYLGAEDLWMLSTGLEVDYLLEAL